MKFFLAAALTYIATTTHGYVFAQTQCDLLASYERDHMAVAPAIGIDALTQSLGIAKTACQKDIADYPDELRLKFQLARVFLADDMKDEGLALMQRVADQEYPAAQYWMGLVYREGHLVWQDNTAAADWYERAVAGGNTHAMYNLAIMKRLGAGYPTDLEGSVELYKQAAGLGHVSAMANLRTMHLRGMGTPQDDDAAFAVMLSAASLGNVDAMYNIATFYEQGIGTPSDLGEAIKWYKEAAALGDQDAITAVKELSP